jgi:hypothetical protein
MNQAHFMVVHYSGSILSFLSMEAWRLAEGYNGHCGLLDASWECGKTEYVLYSLFNPLARRLGW